MSASVLSNIFKNIINTSSDEENAQRLWEHACKTQDNFYDIMERYSEVASQQAPIVAMNIQEEIHQDAEQLQPDQQVQDLFPPANVTIRRISKNEMEALNAMSSAERRRAIDLLNLNDSERTKLVNSLWRLRNPERVRQNSRRSYQNRVRQQNYIQQQLTDNL